ncbi:MAG TPA: glycoside hydrolase family 2 TIM barrel-domain containing protein [Hanamia sp.]|nr:glycoside hydrolase family 2 TIM barrel-domain containing protein [Hanamia sp.]
MIFQFEKINKIFPVILMCLMFQSTKAQLNLITDIPNRNTISLDGKWQYIVDPYETGFYDYRYKEMNENDPSAYWNNDKPKNKTDLKEYGYSDKYTLRVPGDWNSQDPKFLYYEGTVWYKKTFDFKKRNPSDRLFIYFGAVNYRADVYLNGKKLGMHIGGFTPFNFEIPDSILKTKGNFLVVKADNKRGKEEVPTLNTDWWNYGGITRSVDLVEVPKTFIQDFSIHLKKPEAGEAPPAKNAEVDGWVKLNGHGSGNVVIDIPELKLKKTFPVTDSITNFTFQLPQIQLWSPEKPKLYKVVISNGDDKVADKIGFRTIEAFGKKVLLNGKPIFMRGVAMHEEIPQQMRRAYSKKDAAQLFGWAKQLGCNMVRLAHYPYDESMTRMADSLGFLVWSEIPVYWTIDFGNHEVYENAKKQLTEMITRDKNRASIIIWSVGNETPVSSVRTEFMHNLILSARALDSTRMVSAALEVNYNSDKKEHVINDPLGQYVDLVAFNEYLGWYGGLPSACRTANWGTPYDKPLFISETGAGAKYGFHADSLTRFSEEYQAWYYREQIAMFKRMPENWVGLSPWVLADFRSPKRNNPIYQNGWNRKGLFDNNGNKKEAFYILQSYYKVLEKKSNQNK